MATPFSDKDKAALARRGIALAEGERQLAQLRRGHAHLAIERPCTVDDSILRISDAQSIGLCREFAGNRQRFTRFVPASGAASRMFQGLFPAELDPGKVAALRADLRSFPFYHDLAEIAGTPPESLDDTALCSLLLNEDGLGLGGKPKGLLPLHRARDYDRTAFAEHLHESTRIGISRFHFTVSPDHLELFRQNLDEVRSGLDQDVQIDVSFSLQSPQTDTIALDQE